MPFIKLDLDAIEHAAGAAGAAGVSHQQALGGLALLWQWCWRKKATQVSPTQLSGLFSCDGQRMASGLEAFGFLEKVGDDAYRVRGAEKYLQISAAQSAAGAAHKGNLKRGKSPAIAGREPERSSGSPSGSPPALTASSQQLAANSKRSPTASAKDFRRKPLSDRLIASYSDLRGQKYLFHGPRDAVALTALIAAGTDDEVDARWRASLKADGWLSCANLAQLVLKWNDLAGKKPSGPAPPKIVFAKDVPKYLWSNGEVSAYPSMAGLADEERARWLASRAVPK